MFLLNGSERIIASSQAIDRSLVDTKGEDFVKRMQESLPRLPDGSELHDARPTEDVNLTRATCEYLYRCAAHPQMSNGLQKSGSNMRI